MQIFYQENENLFLTEEMVSMSDGVRLYTRCAVPKGAEKHPIVFIRTPYEAAHNGAAHDIESYRNDPYIAHGYAVVLQHCRGRGDSEGEVCIPYSNFERTDGLETLDYIRTLPFYNGEIYLTGESYLATAHFSYLSAKPQDIKGACLGIQADRLFSHKYRGGLLYRLNNIGWWSYMVGRKYPNAKLGEAMKRPYIDAAKRVLGEDVPAFTDTLRHNTCDEYWTDSETYNVIEAMDFPTLLVEGWFDIYTEGMCDMWHRMPAHIKQKSALMVGPFQHYTSVSDNFEYPLPNGNIGENFEVEWFDSIRENRPFKYGKRGSLNYYSIGADEWRTAEDIVPPKETLRLWLGDHILSEAPTKATDITYRYDPDAPTNACKPIGIWRAHEPGSVDSIISFVSDTIQKEESFLGRVRFHLNVSSDCEDTAFYARIYFIEGDSAYNLTEAMGGLVHLAGDYTPGTTTAIDLISWPIAFTLKPGMHVRVDITSESGFYLPHPNVKGHFAYVRDAKIAHNTIHTEGSYVELPMEE